jgi:hypothetical protein
MNGANGTTSVAGVLYLPPGYNKSPPSSGRTRAERESLNAGVDGPLAAGRKTLAESLSRSGFVDLAASLQENFTMCLNYRPAEVEIGDLKPGALRDLVSWVKSEIAANAERSTQVQAHVSPEAAVKLLT